MNTEQGITCHAWNGNLTQIVVSNNTFLLEIYQVEGESWRKLHTLKEHHQLVSAVDWHPLTNRIISSSHDRNVVVWEFSSAWKPVLVNFYQTRGVLDAAWNARGDKFVVGTGSKNIGVGFWSSSLQLWNTRRIKNFASSITTVKFDPSGLVIAAGSTDKTVKVISAYLDDVDQNLPGNFKYSGVRTFGDILYTINADAWVNSLSWSFDSNWLVVVAHNSSVIFSSLGAEQSLMWNGKPFMSVQFLTDSKVVAAGYDYRPIYFNKNGNAWGQAEEVKAEEGKNAGAVQRGVKDMIKGFDGRKDRDVIVSKHKNTISCIRWVDANRFSTSDITGSLFVWRV